MTILVTGASGLIGSHLCRRLALDGYPVVGLFHNTANPKLFGVSAAPPFESERGDIRDLPGIRRILVNRKVRTVFHLAAHVPYRDNPDFIGANSEGTSNMLLACLHSKVEEFIYASSTSVYSSPPYYLPVKESHPTDPNNLYGRTKLYGEQFCELVGDNMRTTVVRYAGVYGSGMADRIVSTLVCSALRDNPITMFGDGNNSSDFVYVDDIVEGTILAWRKQVHETYNIGSGQETNIATLAHKIIDLTGSKSKVSFSGEADRPFRFVADISKARNELGYNPGSLVQGLEKYQGEMSK